MKKRFDILFRSYLGAAFLPVKQGLRNTLLKWLYPGIGIKRWLVVSIIGVILTIFGASRLGEASFFTHKLTFTKVGDILTVALGIYFIFIGFKELLVFIIKLFLPPKEMRAGKGLVDILYEKQYLERGPKIVAIGGGTGLSTLLHGLKEYTSNITAIVTVADDGGSSGRIREQFGILPPGDIRNCLVALAEAEPMMRDLFQFRFGEGSELEGHSFGNLFITAMTKLTGDFEKAVKESSKVLAIRGQVIPSTLNKVTLVAEYKDGTSTEGEAKIPEKGCPIKNVYLKPADATATPEAIRAISEAEVIVLGPGSLYTSILPNLLIKEITEAMAASSAPKIYVCNIMTQYGETDGYSAYDHLNTVINHSKKRIVDYVIVNTADIPENLIMKYKEEKAFLIRNDAEKIRKAGFKVIEDRIVEVGEVIRHDSYKLAQIIFSLFFKA
ncbi:MAG: YvcK family protein [Candidatus Omnitrophota bacterium]|nr:YvcK family protein [Candidatus Omnitrophota bacterium]